MAHRIAGVAAVLGTALLLSGCPKGNADYKAGKQAEALKDYDTALVHYERALKSDPQNAEFRLKATRMRFEAGQFHVEQGQRHRAKGELQLAVAEFEKALAIDGSSPIAEQELRATLEILAARQGEARAAQEAPDQIARLVEGPPVLRPLSRERINLRLTNNAKLVFDAVVKQAGLSALYDPDWNPRPISVELNNVTVEDALDVVALQGKAFWKPVAENIIFVVQDNTQKRKEYEENIVRTFYVSNNLQPQDLTEIVNGLRQTLDLNKVQQINSQNAILIRATPDKMMLAEKLIRDIDKAKPEVVIQVTVLGARRDRMRDLGITPTSPAATISFTPRNPTGSGSDTPSNQMPLDQLRGLSGADYSITLPGATVTALMTDSTTRIIQDPQIRVVDGQPAHLRVGDRVPIATGSFGTGLGGGGAVVSGSGGSTGFINPLVNTQFTYQDVGVNIDITPRIHSNRQVSMKVVVEVSNVSGRVNIGGIEQPIISQRKIEHDVRLQEGEVNVLGGMIERSETRSITGWPGLSKIPILRYLFSGESVETVEGEILIVLTPRIVRLPEITAANLRGVASGTEQNVRVRMVEEPEAAPPTAPPAAKPPATQPQPAAPPATQPAPPAAETLRVARLRFDPGAVTLKPGESVTLGLVVEDVRDLFAIPLMLQFDPKVVSIEEVHHGGFLSGGTQEIAIVHRVDKERGQAVVSATRQSNTAGVSGTGTLISVVLRGVAAGTSAISIVQATARDSQQKAIPLVSTEATVRVQQ